MATLSLSDLSTLPPAQQPAPTAMQPTGTGRVLTLGDLSSLDPKSSAPAEDPTLGTPSQPEPDATGWIASLRQSIAGKQDPRFTSVPSVFSQNRDLLQAPTGTAAMLGASDEQMHDIMKKQLGDRYIQSFKDANGYDLIQYKDASGKPTIGYVNKPGLDTEDVVRGVKGALPYAALGEVAGPLVGGYGLLTRAFAGGLGAGTISAGGDIAQEPLGSQQGIETGKAAINTIGGAIAEPLMQGARALWQKLVVVPKYYDRAKGELTALGKQVAQQLGYDPAHMQQQFQHQFAKAYAANPNDVHAGLNLNTDPEFNIPSTLGQRTKDPEQLMREIDMTYGNQGLHAKTIMQGIVGPEGSQRKAVTEAVKRSIPSHIIGRPLSVPTNATLGQYGDKIGQQIADAQASAKALSDAAWDQARQTPLDPVRVPVSTPTEMSALTGVNQTTTKLAGADLLEKSISDHLGDLADAVSPEITPNASKMRAFIDRFVNGAAPATASGINKIDAVRKALGLMQNGAGDATDRAASRAMYHAFDDWTKEAAAQGYLTGDPAAIANFRTARDISKEAFDIFAPKVNGKLTPAGKLIEAIKDNGATPEKIVDALFSAPKAQIKSGAVEALQRIKRGFDRYLDKAQARTAWNDVRLAHWAKITQSPTGELLGYDALKSNIKAALSNQKSLIDTLYTPAEIAKMGRFLRELERITYKDPNPSRSAFGIHTFAKNFANTLLKAVPGARFALEYSGIPEHFNAQAAKKAVSQATAGARRAASNLSPLVPAVVQSYAKDQ